MPTLILTPRFTPDAQSLWQAAVHLGWTIERLQSWRIPDDLRSVADPVLYLEGLMGPTLAEQFGLRLCEPPEDWLARLPEEYRRRTIYLSTLGEARKLEGPAFVKPPNDKSFHAKVYARGEELPAEFSDEMVVLIAEPVLWEMEFRCFVLDRQVRTWSVYLRNGELQRDQSFSVTEQEASDVARFAAQVLADCRVDLPRATVMDVGVIRGRGWAVIEQNAAWGSGIYGCDPAEVLEVLRYAAVRI